MTKIEQNTTLYLTSPLMTSINHYLLPRAMIIHGKPQVTMYEAAEAKKYKRDFIKYIKEQVKIQNFQSEVNKTQHFYIDCVFYFDRIDKDANNYFKLLLDAITESQCVWADDNVTCERVNAIYYDSENPRIELKIYPVDYIGIFDTRTEYNAFTDRCRYCSRYLDGRCSVLKKAVEGRIQKDIVKNINDDNETEKYNCLLYKTKKK